MSISDLDEFAVNPSHAGQRRPQPAPEPVIRTTAPKRTTDTPIARAPSAAPTKRRCAGPRCANDPAPEFEQGWLAQGLGQWAIGCSSEDTRSVCTYSAHARCGVLGDPPCTHETKPLLNNARVRPQQEFCDGSKTRKSSCASVVMRAQASRRLVTDTTATRSRNDTQVRLR